MVWREKTVFCHQTCSYIKRKCIEGSPTKNKFKHKRKLTLVPNYRNVVNF